MSTTSRVNVRDYIASYNRRRLNRDAVTFFCDASGEPARVRERRVANVATVAR